MDAKTYPSVLTIAGSDSGGGAGIQADLKTISALGCFGTSAITAVTVQNTLGVIAIHDIPADIVVQQIQAVIEDIPPHAIKIGLVRSVEQANAITDILRRFPHIPVIFDPVMKSGSGEQLMQSEMQSVLEKTLFLRATLITPNMDEAACLLKRNIRSLEEMQVAANLLLQTGCPAVLLKGGHLEGKKLFNVYVSHTGEEQIYESNPIKSRNLHGTGCTLSSAIASFLALGHSLANAISLAGEYVHHAIVHGAEAHTGKGNGPLNHFHDPQKLRCR